MAKDRLSGKLAVILHADVAGSTQLVQQDEQLAHERIQEAFRRFSDTIGKYQGRVRELRGDALLAEFKLASDAVTAALAFQADHTDHNTRLNDNIRPRLRIGIALGEVVIADNTVTGAGVVLAQRVEQLAEPEGLCITAAIHEALPGRMPFDQENLGEQVLKGFDEPVRVYRVELSPGESIPPPQASEQLELVPRKWRLIAIVALTALIVGGGGVSYWLKSLAPKEEPASVDRMSSSLSDLPSIAVLPFTNMSGDSEQEYFVDGMTEDLITDLSKLSGLFVIARHSVFTYKGQSAKVQQVAEELGVRYILEGSVRRAGDQIRINAQLIDATTGGHLWAERYDRQLQNIFAIQDEITASIVQALEIRLTTQEKEALIANATINFDAYEIFLRGQRSFRSRDRESISETISAYREAIKLDPEFSRAYGAIAVAMTLQYLRGWTESPLETQHLALELAQKAVAMSNKIPQVYWALGYVHLYRKEHDKAVQATQKAIEIAPNYADAYGLLALIYNHQGNPDAAIASITRGMELNPYYTYDYPYNLGRAQYLSGQYQDAIENLLKSLEKNETAAYPRVYLIASYAKLGLIDDAEWEAEQLQVQSPEITISQLRRTFPQTNTLMDELALDLRKAGLPE
ncbi:MAG: adenylate/guanylate cyclase domain-containing protein [Gammaproteobacteria bacterium]|nr:adenylate/guanylate cyclase domain-containing protein [Gammaproteobacteria bacterium]